MKKLPFDLAKALAGAKLVTRDGKAAGKFRARTPNDDLAGSVVDWPYCADIEEVNGSITFTKNGRAALRFTTTIHDLFLLDERDQPAPVPPMPMVFPPWLTERKFYAACALQGLMSYPESGQAVYGYHAEQAVKAADALITELNKEKK